MYFLALDSTLLKSGRQPLADLFLQLAAILRLERAVLRAGRVVLELADLFM
jgi:hypothetical protein